MKQTPEEILNDFLPDGVFASVYISPIGFEYAVTIYQTSFFIHHSNGGLTATEIVRLRKKIDELGLKGGMKMEKSELPNIIPGDHNLV